MIRKHILIGKMIGILALFTEAGAAAEDWVDDSGQWAYMLKDGCATNTGWG